MKKRFGVIATIVAAASFFSLITASVAWFEARTDVDFGTGHGSTAAAYFESGSGKSEAEAYVISSPIHMYNLAWLQYLGQFNTTVSPTYFKLKNDIDMSALGSALPPIGTQANPFIGIFDGQSHTISNLTVSNNINDIAKHPSTVQALSGVSVVGFFGIVGNPQPIGIQRGDTDLDYTELQVLDKLNLHHFNLQNVVVKSSTAQTLMGIVAGYVNGHDGTVHDIGVMNGSLQAASGATCLDHFAEDDDEDPARPISKFSLIGETEDTEWKEAYDDSGTGSDDGPGDDPGFGGSLDMKLLARRANYMLTKYASSVSSLSRNYGYVAQLDSYNFDFYAESFNSLDNYEFYWQSVVGANSGSFNRASYGYLTDGAILPLGIDRSSMGLDATTEYTKAVKIGSSTYQWHINSYYDSNNSEITLHSNTGYIVGGKTNSGAAQYGTVRLRMDSPTAIQRSLGYTKSVTTTSYDDSRLKLLTHDTSSDGMCIISDDINASAPTSTDFSSKGYSLKRFDTGLNLQKYSSVRANLSEILTGSSLIYSMGFNKAINASSPDKTTLTGSNIYINNQAKSSLQLVKNGVNFNLSSDGFATMICGSFYNTTDPSSSTSDSSCQKFPDFYKVTRTSDTNITSITKISSVWEKDGDYQINLSSANGYTKVYDSSWYEKLPLARAAYYAEVHLPAGEYVIGCDSSSGMNTAYLVYLDIGANGSGGGTDPIPGGGDYDLKNVRYVHQIVNNGSTDSSDDYIDILFKISTVGADGTIALYFSRHDAAMLYYHQDGTATATSVSVTVFIAKETNIQDNTSAVWTS